MKNVQQPITISTELFDVVIYKDQQVTTEQILAIRDIVLENRLQQPDNIERLKAITNEQWRKFAEKYNLMFDVDCNEQFCIYRESGFRVHAQFLWVRDLEGRRRLFDNLLFFKSILAETISEFEYAQNIHDLITELEGL